MRIICGASLFRWLAAGLLLFWAGLQISCSWSHLSNQKHDDDGSYKLTDDAAAARRQDYDQRQRRALDMRLYGTDVLIEAQGSATIVYLSEQQIFEPQTAEINTAFYYSLNAVAQVLAEFRDTHIIIHLYKGQPESLLAKRKLASLKNYFIGRRVSAMRIHDAQDGQGLELEPDQVAIELVRHNAREP